MLNDLHEIALSVQKKYKEEFKVNEIILSDTLKEAYGTYLRENSQNVSFSLYTATVTTSLNKKMYIPNQWFLAASFMVPYVVEIVRYKNETEKVLANMFNSSKDKKEYIVKMKNIEDMTKISILKEKIKSYFIQVGSDTVEDDTNYLTKFITDYEWWFGSKTIDRGDYYVSPVLFLLGVVNVSQGYIADIAYILSTEPSLTAVWNKMIEPEDIIKHDITTTIPVDLKIKRKTGGINEIVYGAPGTGKSRYLEDRYGKAPLTRRVVFHSEYSYFDFIGVYKPVPVYKETDKVFKTIDGQLMDKGEPYIDYKFVPRPFIKVLVEAWLDP
ncbi:5-methylcytosine-specific restriction endonuclease subunit McrB [Alkaliphilus hydrothermalis]|uniref:Gluconate kinase n=1 Tax=Alkaliphilus hydrothermalis TaxID=1482730 RepID=A0ABS2NRN5_9FIRM|nr:hypothetical protein [Alkaliphilus hydrothermalis]MBM7615608.1 gluconate kinase [Alkaliphilus hydrothermalis]